LFIKGGPPQIIELRKNIAQEQTDKKDIKQCRVFVFQKRSIFPPGRKFLPSGGGGEKKLFLIIVNVLGHPKGVGGLTSYFLRGGGMDVFWNDPL
jgi:hypothetical protein